MDLSQLNELDLSNVANWPLPARIVLIAIIFAAVIALGYWLDIKDQGVRLEKSEKQEIELRQTFEIKAKKAANLEAYEQQLAEMKESFGAMLRQLPNKTEVAELLVDISQTGLASGLEFELFKPQNEVPKDFYAELPISIRVKGSYHEFGNFVSGIAALPRIVTVHDVNIAHGTEGDLTMDILAKTYRYIDEDEKTRRQPMIRLRQTAWAASVCLLASSMVACGGSNTEDLRAYVEDVKGRQQARVEPLPEFAPYENYLYQASADRDPFSPPVYSTPKSDALQVASNGISPDFNRAREPLESEPLDSLRMVGTLAREGNSWALIRMSDTTIHRVKPGNYVGQNHGKIVQVSESEVELTEIVPDGLGGWTERQAALALSE